MIMRRYLLYWCVTLPVLMPAQAATLRPFAQLASQSVRLSDLWSGVPAGQDQVIGTGPTPGNQIVVPAAQLAAIAAQFGVDWHPASPADQAVLQRAGRPLDAQQLVAPLNQALSAQGAPAQFDIALIGYTPPLVAPNDLITVTVDSLAFDSGRGRFTALITAAGAQTPPLSVRVNGSVVAVMRLPVLNRLVPPGETIAAQDVTMATLRLPDGINGYATSPRDLVGQALRHILPPGKPLPLDELTQPVAVTANAMVEITLQTNGLTLESRGIAEQKGAVGDVIRVRNPASLAVMLAQITGPNQVSVDPDSQPIFAVRKQEIASQ